MSRTEQCVEKATGPITMKVADHSKQVIIFDLCTKLYLASNEVIVASIANPNSMTNDAVHTNTGVFIQRSFC